MRGAWIEIQVFLDALKGDPCRSPCGERGLKFVGVDVLQDPCPSLPMRGAWIEIEAKEER